jgi:hypothetical protein
VARRACCNGNSVSYAHIERLIRCIAVRRCRDSSLYGRVQTILQDLILDLLKCGDLRVFAHISFRISYISRLSRISCSHFFRAFRVPTQFAIRALTYLAGFAFLRILRISHSRVFHASTCTTAHLPGIHRIPFACPVLILQGPLVRISLGFTCIISHMSLHSHLCPFISLCVYITSPLYV